MAQRRPETDVPVNLVLYVLSLISVLPCFLIGLFFFFLDDIRRHQTGIKALIDFFLTRTLYVIYGTAVAIPLLLALIVMGYFPSTRWFGLLAIAALGSAGLGYIAYSSGPHWLIGGWLVTIPAALGTSWCIWRLFHN